MHVHSSKKLQRKLPVFFALCYSTSFPGALILGDPGAVSGGGKKSKRARKKFGRRKIKNEDFSSPEFFSRPFRLFPAPTNCPWVSEHEVLSTLPLVAGGRGERGWELCYYQLFSGGVHVTQVSLIITQVLRMWKIRSLPIQ